MNDVMNFIDEASSAKGIPLSRWLRLDRFWSSSRTVGLDGTVTMAGFVLGYKDRV